MPLYYPYGPRVEGAFYYVEGGLHPVNIGAIIHDRYRVVRKLGSGINSTVWLVEDLRLKRFASLKIIAANVSAKSSELSISRYLQSLQEQNIVHPGREHVVQIFDTFSIDGPNGTHHCIVTELLGINLASRHRDFYEPRFRFPSDVAKKVVAQLALAVSYLHQYGVIHGDLNPTNGLFYSYKLQTASSVELGDIYGPIDKLPIKFIDETFPPPSPRRPDVLVKPHNSYQLFELCLSSVDDVHIKICDFSEASLIGSADPSNQPFEPHMPRILAPPEVLFNDIASPTTSMDIWGLGVLLYVVVNGQDRPPFFAYNGIAEEVIESIVKVLGEPPSRWWKKWSEMTEYSDDEDFPRYNTRRRVLDGMSYSVDESEYSADERDSFTRVLTKIFRYNPKQRISADDVVRQLPRGWVHPQTLEKLEICCRSPTEGVLGRGSV